MDREEIQACREMFGCINYFGSVVCQENCFGCYMHMKCQYCENSEVCMLPQAIEWRGSDCADD